MRERQTPRLEQIDLFEDRQPRDGAGQMALDEVITHAAERPLLRTYCWSEPAVTFGYAQRWRDVASFRAGLPHVRRWTGGGIVLHEGDRTFSLFVPGPLPVSTLPSPQFYHWLHRAIVSALRTCGCPARLARPEDLRDGPVCFEAPVVDDVLLDGRKVAGGAQRRTRRGLLHQGSLSPGVAPEDFGRRLAAQLATTLHRIHAPAEWEPALRETAGRYASDDWNRKR